MIFIGIGSNLPSASGDSRDTVFAALQWLDRGGVALAAHARLWRTQPVPVSNQPWYINTVAAVETRLDPAALLAYLHRIEHEFGRERHEVNAARSLDLDIIDYRGKVSGEGETPILPHPRLEGRAFVLRPLAEIAPDWQHPASGRSIYELIAALPANQVAEPCDD